MRGKAQQTPRSPPPGAAGGKDACRRAVTLRSVGVSILAMVVISSAMMFSGPIAGAAGDYGTETVAITAIWTIVALSAVGAGLFAALRRRLLTRAELFCIFFSVFISSPLIAHGYWRFMLSRLVGIPWSSDFQKLDAYPEKLWPHGPNLTAGLLQFKEGRPLSGRGNFSWKKAEIDAGVWARVPTLENVGENDVSWFRVPIAVAPPKRAPLIPGKPHRLSVLVRARDLAADAY